MNMKKYIKKRDENNDEEVLSKKQQVPATLPKNLRDCLRWALGIDKDVIVSAASGTFERLFTEITSKWNETVAKGFSSPKIEETRWWSRLYVEENSDHLYETIAIVYHDFPTADEAYNWLIDNKDIVSRSKAKRIVQERLHREFPDFNPSEDLCTRYATKNTFTKFTKSMGGVSLLDYLNISK